MPLRICPNCKEVIPIGGVEFDSHNNVVCVRCKQPIIATTVEHEAKIKMNSIPATSSPAAGKVVTNIPPHQRSYAKILAETEQFAGCFP